MPSTLIATGNTRTFAASKQTTPDMANQHTPRPTRSTLQNRRLNRAIRAAQLGNADGLRTASRRSALPRARRQDVAVAITGSLLIFLLVLLLAV